MSIHTKGKIGVKNIEFHLKKGLYPSELLVENHFSVTACVHYYVDEIKKDTYLNYERLAEIIHNEMHRDVNLLETVAENCLKQIMQEWPFAVSSNIVIEKLHPAFSNFNLDAVVVEMEMNR